MGRASYCALEQRQPLGFQRIEFVMRARETSRAGFSHVCGGDMILGLSIQTFTITHVVISLVAIASGILVLIGMFSSRRMPGWTAFFLLTTVLTSVTGFLFPIHGFTPALGTGIVSCVLLALALYGLYGKHLAGAWRWIYVACAAGALYLNVLVLIVQSFQKVPALKPLAPTQSEPPFLIAQGVALVVFLIVGIAAALRFRPVRDFSTN
jgi:hypothetical protein